MLQSFVPLFVMTFFICLFIVLMQFLWRFIDDLVGKGLSVDVIGELFFYAALTMIPMALPLAILLASLMTFGNLGERFELTAIKASGVSLLKVMRPLIVLMVLIAIGAFFFQNDVLPVAQTKMWTLIYSVRQKSPEVEIPEGVFYEQIPGYNLYVAKKNPDTGTLYNMMIYDVSKGFDNASVILADSGKLAMTEDKMHLFLTMWQGESFENLRDAAVNMNNVPYRRESFDLKEILVTFDANFNRMDEDGMRNQYVGKNISQLQATIDSVHHRVDSVGEIYGREVVEAPRVGMDYYDTKVENGKVVRTRKLDVPLSKPVDVDSVFRGASSGAMVNYLNQAANKARMAKASYEFKGLTMADDRRTIRRHAIELQKKFTLSFACIIFFFIGAPLGAIIRKGGLGMPLVISVFLFIFYYIIDNTGYKMAREGKIAVWQGMWLSSAVLLPLGVFFTYKAMRDSAVFNKDAYVNFLRRITGRVEKRSLDFKELAMVNVEPAKAHSMLEQLRSACADFLASNPATPGYIAYWLHGYSRTRLTALRSQVEQVVDYISNSRSQRVVAMLNELPILRSLWIYHPVGYKAVAWAAIICFPIGVPLYLIALRSLKKLRAEVSEVSRVAAALQTMIQ